MNKYTLILKDSFLFDYIIVYIKNEWVFFLCRDKYNTSLTKAGTIRIDKLIKWKREIMKNQKVIINKYKHLFLKFWLYRI